MPELIVHHIVTTKDKTDLVDTFFDKHNDGETVYRDGSERLDSYKEHCDIVASKAYLHDPVTMNITRNLINRDAELDCMDCLDQMMIEFDSQINDDERNRIATWFKDRYFGEA